MPALTIQLPAPHTAQRAVLATAKRFNVVCCGRRWGKSTIGIDRIVRPALEGSPCGWFSPGYKLLAESWRALQELLAPVITSRNNAEFRLELRGGGSITMFSLDTEVSDSVRGRAFRCVVIDEAALVRNLRETWERSIRATLADYRGEAWFLSTPRGYGDFKLFYDRGADPEREDWASWQMPTESNPFIDPEEIAAARSDMTAAAFSQEFLAEFISWEGAVFRHVQDCATSERRDAPEAGHDYVIGADWGRSNDFTVFAVLDVTGRRLVDLDRSNRLDYAVQRGRLQALCDRWRPRVIIAEQNSIGQSIIEELQRAGLPVVPFTTTNASKAVIVEALALAFEQRAIEILDDPVLLGELQAFEAQQLPSGLIRYAAPGGGHDDTVIALALAWSEVQSEPTKALYRLSGCTYDDESRPVSVLSKNGSTHLVVVHLGVSETIFALFIDDRRTIWLEREHYAPAKPDSEVLQDLIAGIDEWPGLGDDRRWWPAVIVPTEAQGFAAQARARGIYVISSKHEDEIEEAIRRTSSLIAQGKLRIHRRCANVLRLMRSRSWDEALTLAGKKSPDVCRTLVATRIPKWRLTI